MHTMPAHERIAMPTLFTTESLRAALGARPFKFFERVGSTQDIARDWALDARDPAPPGAAVIAEEQTAGRGRQGRAWFSPPGSSVMVSVVLRPDLPPERIPRCTMVAGLGVIETLRPLLGEAVALKWPNDVLMRGKKLCGVLAEATWTGSQLGAVIVGIGINVRTDFTRADLNAPATSIEAELGRAVDRRDLLRDLLARIDHWAAQVNDPALFAAWRAQLGTLGKRVTVYTEPAIFPSPHYSGVAESVDADGALLVRLDSGKVRRVLAADVGLAES